MNKNTQKGFTLIELMIVVAILGIVAVFAYNSYSKSVQKSRRSDAKNALLHAATLQERHYTLQNQYTGDESDVGGSVSEKGYYSISASTGVMNGGDCDTGTAGVTCFVVTATAQNAQAGDADCAIFSIDNVGRREALDSSNNTNLDCW
jgi:type IV pilus assembly protein PilE